MRLYTKSATGGGASALFDFVWYDTLAFLFAIIGRPFLEILPLMQHVVEFYHSNNWNMVLESCRCLLLPFRSYFEDCDKTIQSSAGPYVDDYFSLCAQKISRKFPRPDNRDSCFRFAVASRFPPLTLKFAAPGRGARSRAGCPAPLVTGSLLALAYFA